MREGGPHLACPRCSPFTRTGHHVDTSRLKPLLILMFSRRYVGVAVSVGVFALLITLLGKLYACRVGMGGAKCVS